MKTQNTQQGSVHVVIISVLVVAILATLGYVLWNNFANKTTDTPPTTTPNTVTEDPKTNCSAKEDEAATDGVFCSDAVGIKFTVPSIFKGKVKVAKAYEVFKSSIDPSDKTSVGNSEAVFEAKITGNDNFTFTIAQEPARTGYVDVSHMLRNTYYSEKTGLLSLVSPPTNHYDSDTDTTTTTGSYKLSDTVPSFKVGDTRVFKGINGDAGVSIATYFAVINDKIVKITLRHNGYMGDPAKDPSTIDGEKAFKELDTAVHDLTIY